MYFLSLCIQNVTTRKVRALLTGLTIAISIATVVTMGVLTESLRNTAISVLQTGKADFSIAQKGLSDVIYSSLDQKDLEDVRSYDGVQSAVGVLVAPVKLDDQHPFFLQLGLQPEQLNDFGVEIVAGQAYDPGASDQLMLGYRAAREFGKTIGDQFDIDGRLYRVTGIYRTGTGVRRRGGDVPAHSAAGGGTEARDAHADLRPGGSRHEHRCAARPN